MVAKFDICIFYASLALIMRLSNIPDTTWTLLRRSWSFTMANMFFPAKHQRHHICAVAEYFSGLLF